MLLGYLRFSTGTQCYKKAAESVEHGVATLQGIFVSKEGGQHPERQLHIGTLHHANMEVIGVGNKEQQYTNAHAYVFWGQPAKYPKGN